MKTAVPTLTRQLDATVRKEMSCRGIPGVVLAVEKNGRLLHRKSYGNAVLRVSAGEGLREDIPLRTEHIFDLASLTKVFATVFAVMVLVDREALQLDEPVCRYVKGFDTVEKKAVTVRNLLNHTAGLTEWFPLYLYVADSQSAIDFICSLPLKYGVGEGRQYSDLGFMILAHIVELVSGRPLDEFLDRNLYQPLGLPDTCFKASQKSDVSFAATSVGNPFERTMIAANTYADIPAADLDSFDGWRSYLLQGEVNDMNAHYVFQGVAGHAGLFSTVDDLLVLSRLILNRGGFNGKIFLKESTVDQFITRDRYNNGLGWAMEGDIVKVAGPPAGTIGHTGFCGTSAVLVPARQISIVLLTNRQQAGIDCMGNYPDVNPLRYEINRTVISCL
jgi:CubicO group peptidase (beta-lactamase class C family)